MNDAKAQMSEEKQPWTFMDTAPLLTTVYCWFMLYNHEWDKAACLFVALVWMLGWDISRSLRHNKALPSNTTVQNEVDK